VLVSGAAAVGWNLFVQRKRQEEWTGDLEWGGENKPDEQDRMHLAVFHRNNSSPLKTDTQLPPGRHKSTVVSVCGWRGFLC
jgi:hypothetical protein